MARFSSRDDIKTPTTYASDHQRNSFVQSSRIGVLLTKLEARVQSTSELLSREVASRDKRYGRNLPSFATHAQ